MYDIGCDIGCDIVYDITTSMSKFFLGCRRKTYDISIRYGGRSKKTVFGNFDIKVLTFDIEEKKSISLYDIGGRSKKTVLGNFDIEVFSTIS